jgi:hypothetical protein
MGVIIDCQGQIWIPDEGDDEMDPYQHAKNAECMACGQQLKDETLILVDIRGLLGIWDSPDCMANMHAITFLRKVEETVVAAIDERAEEDG